MFKLLYPDGQYSAGGTPSLLRHCVNREKIYLVDGVAFPTKKDGKMWNLISHIKSHLKNVTHYDYVNYQHINDIDKLAGSIIIEYEIVEKRRIPIEEFMKEE
jgi:hypothetical protein